MGWNPTGEARRRPRTSSNWSIPMRKRPANRRRIFDADRFGSKLQIVSSFNLVDVGSPKHRLAGVNDGADEAGRGGSGRPDGDVGGGAAFAGTRSTTGWEQARRFD